MPPLYPMMSAPENFKIGDCVRKFISENSVTPYIGVVTQIIPATYKVWVQWPIENTQESPETLIKVNPEIFGMPTVVVDRGYSSYEKSVSDKLNGQIPKRVMAMNKMTIRIAHTYATKVVAKLVDNIEGSFNKGLKDVQAYNKAYDKFADTCSDYIILSSVKKIYKSRVGQ